ncbi:hypothetical protein C8D77_11191 [Mesorhizobium loti]|uniref:Uncharacterized protein n=1 Tax=Rhizobium loti TaxID=381 RepID=A0A8E2W8A1_RHILI|nr:hypothetical protein [Mesorhizobium loti]PWJ88369.1 hypothetical protein C8D77_11191 [Mesorhizobium loti]
MRRIVISEAVLRQRQEIQEQRNRYYQARSDGFSREEANALANGAEVAPAANDRHQEFSMATDERAFIEQPDQDEQPAGPIEIPDDWKFLPYLPRSKGGTSLRGLATKLSDQPINSAADAVAAIEAELAMRG